MEAVAEQAKASSTKKDTVKITVCKSLSGIAEGAEEVYKEFEKQIEEKMKNNGLKRLVGESREVLRRTAVLFVR